MIIKDRIKKCKELMNKRNVLIDSVVNKECEFKDVESEIFILSSDIDKMLNELDIIFRRW